MTLLATTPPPPLPSRPDLLIFDCDGVLIDSEALSARALIEELAVAGVRVDLGFVARHCIGRAFGAVVARVQSDFGVALPESFEAAYRARLLDAFARDLVAMAGVTETLDALKVPFCLATSSSPPRLAASLKLVGLDRVFEGRAFTASEVSRGKPAPDLFLHAAARMGADPARCAVLEDSAAGLAAAHAAGMQAWRFTGGSHFAQMQLELPDGLSPHRSFGSFAEMRCACPDLFTPASAGPRP